MLFKRIYAKFKRRYLIRTLAISVAAIFVISNLGPAIVGCSANNRKFQSRNQGDDPQDESPNGNQGSPQPGVVYFLNGLRRE